MDKNVIFLFLTENSLRPTQRMKRSWFAVQSVCPHKVNVIINKLPEVECSYSSTLSRCDYHTFGSLKNTSIQIL